MRILLATVVAASLSGPAWAADLHATVKLATPTGPGADIGGVTVTQTARGADFKVDLHGLPPGPHGFHVHEHGDCGPSTANGQVVPAGAAGGHYDPGHSGHHMGPEGAGHLGDLPLIQVGPDGTARTDLIAPRIKDIAALKGLALMIHAGGDTYSDEPTLGGGGARLACGVLE